MNRKARFFIGVDCEGAACVVGEPHKGLKDSVNYPFAARQAALEADAAARALFDWGAEEVIVWDNHGSGVNLDYSLLDPRCKILLGSGCKTRFPGIDGSFDGVLFIGYHAREGTSNAVLAHTYSSLAFQSYQINGMEVGEMEIDGAFAGKHGVPVIFVSSDDKCVSQAKERFPWAETVTTKESLGWNMALSLHPQAAADTIYQGVQKACARLSQMEPFEIKEPLSVAIRFKRMDDAAAASLYDRERKPFALLDGFIRTGVLDRLEDLFL